MIAGRITAPLGTYEWREQFNYSHQLNVNMPIFFAIGCVGCIIGNLCYRPYKKLKSGIQGEERTLNILKNLPINYTVLSNVQIEYDGKRSEIDNLIMSTRGLIIVETKNYKGTTTGKENDSEWIISKTSSKGNTFQDSIKNPIKQVKRQTYILSQILKENSIYCWIDGYVYMAGGQCHTDSDKVYTEERKLLQIIIDSGRDNALSDEDMRRIQQVLKL